MLSKIKSLFGGFTKGTKEDVIDTLVPKAVYFLKDDAELTAREVLEIQLRFDARFIRGYTPKATERVFITHRQWRQLPSNLQSHFEHGFIER